MHPPPEQRRSERNRRRIGSRIGLAALLWLMRASVRLPHRMRIAWGAGIGSLLHRWATKRRKVVRRNLALCFPEFKPGMRDRLARDHFRALGMSLMETSLAWWGDDPKIFRRARIIGAEHLADALSHGEGVLLFGGHFTAFEIGGRILARRFSVAASYRPHDDPRWDAVIRKGRQRYLETLIEHKNMRGMIRYLRGGGILWYAPDQNFGGPRRVFARFFAQRAATTTATSWLIRSSGARVVPYLCRRREDDSGWDVILSPALDGFPSGDDLADTERLNTILEGHIEQNIEQYLWIHRRFKDRPPGESDVYGPDMLRDSK
ncbi:LpxL/LpxP family acyltransferase [Thioalkalivibrio sp. HK1]|uniref:LpxL/LpxP family acyltransferase n=1 Tax=Thioalkalivibrio sp. HK1 TaxID=1469245 RepID=UPI0018CBF21A|nr:lipid A biosynthesis acyltransferase [Thioalkalivibrio sp. HK1]